MSKRQMQMAGTTFEVVCVCVHMSTVDVFVVWVELCVLYHELAASTKHTQPYSQLEPYTSTIVTSFLGVETAVSGPQAQPKEIL